MCSIHRTHGTDDCIHKDVLTSYTAQVNGSNSAGNKAIAQLHGESPRNERDWAAVIFLLSWLFMSRSDGRDLRG